MEVLFDQVIGLSVPIECSKFFMFLFSKVIIRGISRDKL